LLLALGIWKDNFDAGKKRSESLLEAGRERSESFDKIQVRLERLLDEPGGFSVNDSDADAEQKENNLRSLANSVRSDIGDIVVDLRQEQFDKENVLNSDISKFFALYEQKIQLDNGVEWQIRTGDYSQQYTVKQLNNYAELNNVIKSIMALKN